MRYSMLDDITRYYDETVGDYKLIWRTGKHLSMHMGYSDEDAYKHSQAVVRMIKELAYRARITRDDTVADLGCGIGGSSIWLAENIGCVVIGVDINPRSISAARAEAEKRKLGGLVTFVQGSYSSIPLVSKTVNVAWFLESLCYSPNKRITLQEADRVLTSGGRIVIADGFKVTDGEELALWLEGWAVPELATVQEIESCLESLGFRVSHEDITARVMPSLRTLHSYGRRSYLVGVAMEKVGLRTSIQTGNIIGAIYAYESALKGQWCYGIFAAEKSL
jgi:ubiquinone/menaquinone biosynthesis C-methylase UbiE